VAAPDVLARLLDDDILDDPYPYLAWVREHHPVHLSPSGAYLVSRHADCMTLLLEDGFRVPDREQLPGLQDKAARHRSLYLLTRTITMHNPPEHTRLRRLLGRDFTRSRIERLRAATGQTCDRLLGAIEQPLCDGEIVDLHRTLSVTLPMHVMSDLMGFPAADRAWLFGMVPTVLAGLSPSATEEVLDRADEQSAAVEDYMIDLLAQRRREPANDLASVWGQAHADDSDRFSHDELLSMLWGMIAGGLATTSAALSNGIVAIIRYPSEARWLRGGQDKALSFANEILRRDMPSIVSGVPRYATRDVELGGVTIPHGSEVRNMLAAANRDPAVFPDPDRFAPSRDTSRTLAFGHGIHYCMGSSLARIQLTTMLPAMHRRFPGLDLAGAPRWRRSLPLRSIESLPAALTHPPQSHRESTK
jgi:cytochrome P450 family 114